jgi:hypothetical protein
MKQNGTKGKKKKQNVMFVTCACGPLRRLARSPSTPPPARPSPVHATVIENETKMKKNETKMKQNETKVKQK